MSVRLPASSRATKLVVILSNLGAIWLCARQVSRGYPPILLPSVVAFLVSAALAVIAGDLVVSGVLATVYVFPALCGAWFHDFVYSYYAIWLAALAGAILPRSLRTGWSMPARWKAPLVLWSLALALSWPLVVLREIDFVPALLDRGDLWNSRNAVPPPLVVVWVCSVASIVLTGLLLLDWMFAAYPKGQLKRFEKQVIWPMFGAAACAAMVAVYQAAVDMTFLNPTAFGTLGRAVGTMRDANAFGMVAAMWVPIAAAVIVGTGVRRSGVLVLGAATLALLTSGVWASGSRTALLCALGGLVVLGTAVRGMLSRRQILTGAGAAAVLVLALIFIVPASTTGPLKRFRQLVPGMSQQQLLSTAAQLWSRDMYGVVAQRMIKEHPFVGVGVGGFSIQYADTLYLINGSWRPPDNAQNWFRQELAELGLLGSAGWIVWTALFIWMLARARGPADRRPAFGAVKGSVIGLGVASLLGMPTQDIAASITFVVLAVWCLKLAGAEDERAAHARPWPEKYEAPVIWIVLLCFCAGTAYEARTELRPAVRAEHAAFPYEHGWVAVDENDRDFRWTGKYAVSVFPKADRYVRVLLGAVAPDVSEQRPVEVKIWRNGELIFDQKRQSSFPMERWVRLPAGANFARIEIEAGRTWRATDIGRDDPQERGVAVGKWEFAYWTPKGAVVIE